jgi:hypothetical protein
MKKYLPHIILILVLGGAIFMLLTSENQESRKKFNDRLSFRIKDKIPYGYWVAYNNLKYLFPNATISTNKKEPGYWDSLSVYDNKQALLIFSPYFYPEDEELTKLINFAKNGNDVFISSIFLSKNAQDIFRINTSFFDYSYLFPSKKDDDTLHIYLQTDSVKNKVEYGYPGRRLTTYLGETDETVTYELGFDELNRPNFIRLRAGKGNVYVHTVPLAFSNYFLLHKNNMGYYENALSMIPKDTKQLVWDEYFLFKQQYMHESPNDSNDEGKGFMSVLFQYPGLKWGFLSALFLLALFVFIEMRRKQRYIPEIKKPSNDSLEFVKTIGRLYFEKRDHNNLCRKLSIYFLEYIRNRYNLVTTKLDENFIKTLQYKTGYPENDLRGIISFINNINTIIITDAQLKTFHQKLEDFYKRA